MPSKDDPLGKELVDKIVNLDYVKDFQRTEKKLRSDKELWSDYEKMRSLQKEAVLYQQIGKMQAFKATSHAAQQIEKHLKANPLVEAYFLKMQDVSDLLQYVTGEIEEKVNAKLAEK